MKKWLALDAFRSLGANTNDAYAWSAQSDEGEITVLTLWEDEIQDDGNTVVADFMNHPKLKTWVGQRRNAARRRHLQHVWDGDRKFRVVMLRARDVNAMPRSTAMRWPDERLIMELLEYNPTTGEFRAEGTRAPDAGEAGTVWSDRELDACVAAYRRLWMAQEQGSTLNKSALRREVVARVMPGRGEGAYERRMQNISAVIQDLGLPLVKGYLPLKNVGAAKPRIIELINRYWDRSQWEKPTVDEDALQTRVESARQKLLRADDPPPGSRTVPRVSGSTNQFVRDPNVVAWVLLQASGVCEACAAPAPFLRNDGQPYLEVHHVRPLSEGGPDTVDNAIAACPNCHRRLHHSDDRKVFRRVVIDQINRLIDHPMKVSVALVTA